MIGEGFLFIYDFAVFFEGEGTLSVGQSTANLVTFTGIGELSIESSSNYGFALIPAIVSQGQESADFPGWGDAMIPPIFSSGTGGFYTPPDPEYGVAFIPAIQSFGYMNEPGGQGSAYIPSLVSQGVEGPYGSGVASIPTIQSFGWDDFGPQEAPIISIVYAFSGAGAKVDMIVFINERGEITDTISGSRIQLESILASINATGSIVSIGSFLASAVSQAYATTSSSGIVEYLDEDIVISKPSVNDTNRVWVVNIDTGASGQYDGYGFNSFFEEDGICYGVAEDGIYQLDGTTDSGQDIDALLEIGKSNFGIQEEKKIINVYAGVRSDNTMLLKVDADGESYIYEARRANDELSNTRFDVGKGLKGNYYNFTLLNNEGGDFELETMSFEPVTLSRKI